MGRGSRDHEPKTRTKARRQQEPREPAAIVGIPDRDDPRVPIFSFEHADVEHAGAWSWATAEEAASIFRFMSEAGRRSWAELMRAGRNTHHIQDVGELCDEAQARLAELGHDRLVDMLFRFSLGHRERLWGFVTEGVFFMLWWDRGHRVYPLEDR